ncbi:hypothetical protein ISU10_19780 [Nocardioides agariphilus]|uniref:Uncharacterized protein n=1 Tax=Nocardioides agariphilus TaxID=433664 RepID=A0A930VM33_9ACTN|nr:hypothetical protein [Nocardioides agariphilus]MBF4770019.1 hypothetical protein [Nocardioides agariphilus]
MRTFARERFRITRRVCTTAAAVALAGSVVSTTGSAAFAGKPAGGGTTTLAMQTEWLSSTPPHVYIGYDVPAKVSSVSCTLDGLPYTPCLDPGYGTYSKQLRRTVLVKNFQTVEGAVPAEHTFAVRVIAGKTTYVGSTTFTLGL